MTQQQRILVGVVGAPHGIKGEVRVKSFTSTPSAIGSYGPLATDNGRPLTTLGVRPVKDDMVVARFEGVSTREAAAALTNTRLYVDRAVLPATDEEEFYHADLIGLRAETTDGAGLGRVVAIENFGAGDLLEIAPDEGETILVAFTKAFVPTIDLAGGRVIVSAEALTPTDPSAEAPTPADPSAEAPTPADPSAEAPTPGGGTPRSGAKRPGRKPPPGKA